MNPHHLRLVPPHPLLGAALDRFAAGTSSVQEAATVVRHLLAGCRQCSERLALAQGYRPREIRYDDRLFERSLDRAWARFERQSVAGG
ncbi:MAG TPA: hypothetical protein VHN15_09100 [Thermoanaerobaculia bacterium]|nr:hypothetical protein [Thermoanaerobaculia bacterium]